MTRQPAHPPLLLTHYKRQRLVESTRGVRSALAMYETSDELRLATERLTEAELWLSRAPITPTPEEASEGGSRP